MGGDDSIDLDDPTGRWGDLADRVAQTPDLLIALRDDQVARWGAGEVVIAEEYLTRFPGLSHGDRLTLVIAEVGLWHGRGVPFDLAGYQARFPDLADELARECRHLTDLTVSSAGWTRTADGSPVTFGPPGGQLPVVPGFEVEAVAGEGAMGEVYRARQVHLNRVVALKMVHHGRVAGPKDLNRFLAEAEAVAAVRHPNIVQVYESGQHNGRPFLALEYLPGGTLTDRLKAVGRLDPAAAAGLTAKLARGIHAAHDQNIVHRDLKPGNVLFDAAGEPKVTDFGLAKRGGSSDLTNTVAVMGTPAYMAPEQASGRSKFVGPAADVWALGAILYECLTGARPFDGPDQMAVLVNVREAEPERPRRRVPGLPRDLELICLKCLEKSPADRYPTAAALADDLTRFAAGEPVSVRAANRVERTAKWARRKPALAALSAAVAAVALIGLAAVTLMWLRAERARADEETARVEAENAQAEAEKARADAEAARVDAERARADADRARVGAERDRDAAVTARGEALKDRTEAVEARGAAEKAQVRARDLLLRQYAADAVRGLNDGDPVATLIWSAEGLKEAAGDPAREREHRLRIATVLRNSWGFVGAWPVDATPTFTPDGRTAIVVQEGSTRKYDPATGRPSGTPSGRGLDAVVLSPDGRYFANITKYRGAGFAVRDLATGEVVTKGTEVPDGVYALKFTPDSKAVVVGTSVGSVTAYAVADGKVLWKTPGNKEEVDWLQFDPAGRSVLVGTSQPYGVRRTYDAAGRVATVNWTFFPFGADGTVRAWDATTGKPQGPGVAVRMRSSAAGFDRAGRPLLVAYDDGDLALDVRDLVTGEARPLALPGGLGRRPFLRHIEFSPDRTKALAVWDNDDRVHVWDVGTARPLCAPLPNPDRGGEWGPETAFSPDGRRVVAAAKSGAVHLFDLPSGRKLDSSVRHPPDLTAVRLSPDGMRLLTAGRDGFVRVWAADNGRPVGLPISLPGPVTGAGFCPDGVRVWAIARSPATGESVCTVWECPTRARPQLVGPTGTAGPVAAAGFAGEQRLVVERGGKLVAIDPTTGKEVRPGAPLVSGGWSPVAEGSSTTQPIWTPDLTRLAVIRNWHGPGSAAVVHGQPASVELWNWETGKVMAVVARVKAGRVTAAEFSPRGDRLATAVESDAEGEGQAVELWDAATGARVARLEYPHPGGPSKSDAARPLPVRAGGLVFSPDGKTLYASEWVEGDRMYGAAAWDADTGRPVRQFPFKTSHPFGFSPDGRFLLAGDKGVRGDGAELWDLGAEKPGKVRGIAGQVTAAVFGPTGLLATVQPDGVGSVVRVRDGTSAFAIAPAVPYPTLVDKVAFDRTGDRVLVVTAREVQVLDARTARPLTPRLRAPRPIHDARFAADGEGVTAALGDGTVVRWDTSPIAGDPKALARLAETWVGRRLDRTGTPAFLSSDEYFPATAALPGALPGPFTRDAAAAGAWPAGERQAVVQDLIDRSATAARRGDVGSAEPDWTRVLELLPDDPRTLMARGLARAGTLAPGAPPADDLFKQWDAGTADILRALPRSEPAALDPEALNHVVWAVASRSDAGPGRYKVADRVADAVRDRWRGWDTLNTLGVARYRAGRDPEAIEALTRSDTLRPQDPSNLAFLAMAHARSGNVAQARDFLARAERAAKGPDNAVDAEVRGFLQEARAAVPKPPAGPRPAEAGPPPRAVKP